MYFSNGNNPSNKSLLLESRQYLNENYFNFTIKT